MNGKEDTTVIMSDLSCRGKNSNQIYGTAAALRILFNYDEVCADEADFKEYKRLIHELGYDASSEDDF